jgi:lipopolysaccharide/colanic/teichoic acid biosynthesis glycosyltransferase
VTTAPPRLEDTLISGFTRLASDAPHRRIDAELRTLDILLASAFGIVLLPVGVVIAGIVLATSGRPVLYRGERVGRRGRFFEMLKFRTMKTGAEERIGQYLGPELMQANDAELTAIGRWLKASQLDEIPQLWNVLRGEMSLIGPRPLPLRDYTQLEGWHRKRYLVLPGVTGLWQISGRSNLGFDDLVRLDFYYLENWSIWLDISILVKTPFAVLGRDGAY